MVDSELPITQLTWAALLFYWMDSAKASVAQPNDAEGQRWKDSIAAIITLQAVTFALSTVHEWLLEKAWPCDRSVFSVISEDDEG